MVQKPSKKLVYYVMSSAIVFTTVVVVVAINYHFEAIEHDSGPINQLLNINNQDDEPTIIKHTKKGIIMGYIANIDGKTIVVKHNKLNWVVETNQDTIFRAASSNLTIDQFKINENVIVLGDTNTNSSAIKAVLIRKK